MRKRRYCVLLSVQFIICLFNFQLFAISLVEYPSIGIYFNQDNPVELVTYLPKNYVKDGSKDYTEHLQKGLNENNYVCLPDFPVKVNSNGLKLKSNQVVIFQNNSKLLMAANSLKRYAILQVWGIKNTRIINPTLIGDRDKHIGNVGEWGMGINIVGSHNIEVVNPNIINCWGDGIYIGQNNNIPSSEIIIKGGKIDKSRRNGISITSAKNVNIDGLTISNTKGINPRQGICIEPNNSNDVIENLVIKNLKTISNEGGGIGIILPMLLSSKQKNVSIKIDRHVDNSSQFGVAIQGFKGKPGQRSLLGSIEITNSSWNNNKQSLFVKPDFYNSYAPKLKVENSKSMRSGKMINSSFKNHL